MKYSDESYDLRIELDTENFEISPDEIEDLERALDPLRELVKKFPVANLYITIQFYPRSNNYRVKTVLRLPGRGLATGELEKEYYSAFERCVRKLIHKVISYEGRLEEEEDRAKHLKGTRHEIVPAQEINAEQIDEAIQEGNYAKFRRLMYGYEEPVRKRIGRWITRYPLIEAQLDDWLKLDDVVEEVVLNAFERFENRPKEVPLGEWLESLIDPSLKMLSENPDDEMQNISLARSLCEPD